MYDPLINTHPNNQAFAPSYWATTQALPKPTATLSGRMQTDVAIIGGGYTGLLTAYYLSSEFGIDCHVLEANQVGFGASARNAGFVLKGSGRLSYEAMTKRWDLATTKGIYEEFTQGVARVEGLIKQHNIACEPQESGYLKIAHNAKALTTLKNAANYIQRYLADDHKAGAEFISANDFRSQYLNHHQAYGALRLKDGFGLNPLKLLLAYKSIVQAQGVHISEQSCVEEWIEDFGKHRLITNKGELIANKVVVAGNAYTPKRFNSHIDNKFLPILSNIIVTEPLSQQDIIAAGLHTHQVTMDTRILKYYYRLLPDKRLLFGGRGAVWGKDAENPVYAERLKLALNKSFPTLTNKKVAYKWSGWIAAALDDMPHVYSRNGICYSLGYCGAGVSFSSQAAFRLAQSIAGETLPNLPLYNQALPNIPFAKARRLGQWTYYHYAWLKDRLA